MIRIQSRMNIGIPDWVTFNNHQESQRIARVEFTKMLEVPKDIKDILWLKTVENLTQESLKESQKNRDRKSWNGVPLHRLHRLHRLELRVQSPNRFQSRFTFSSVSLEFNAGKVRVIGSDAGTNRLIDKFHVRFKSRNVLGPFIPIQIDMKEYACLLISPRKTESIRWWIPSQLLSESRSSHQQWQCQLGIDPVGINWISNASARLFFHWVMGDFDMCEKMPAYLLAFTERVIHYGVCD